MIRRAVATDIVQVAALYHAVWHETQAPFMPAEACAHRSMKFFVNFAPSLMTASEAEMVKEAATEAELHCVIGNYPARRFYERMGWLHGEIHEQVFGEHGPVEVAFWRMIKVLAIHRAY